MMIADELLPLCAVRIDVRQTPAGTGFFVAPGLIVTCAHVVESPADPSQPVAADDIRALITRKEIGGTVTQERTIEVDVRRFDAKSDLAVLTVRSPFAHPSVLLDSRDALARDKLHTFAYPELKLLGVPRLITADGKTGDNLIAFSQAQIQPGMSGAPLFNFRTGAVCGVISLTRDKRQDLGGYAIPIKRLFAVDPKLRGANGGAHDRGSHWVRALSIDQRQGWQASRTLEVEAEARSFTVSLGQSDEGWSVTAEDSDAGPTAQEWVDLNAVREEVARLFRDWASRGRVEESDQLRLLGGILFSAACPGSIGERLRELSRSEGEPVIVNLCFESGLNQRVVQLPWEHLCIPEAAERELYLATDEHFGLARIIPRPVQGDTGQDLSEGLSVALVAVHDEEAAQGSGAARDVTSRVAGLAAKELPGLTPTELENPDADDLSDALHEAPPAVLHYVGTGKFSHGRDEIALGPTPGLQYGPVEMLLEALPEPRPRLVVLQMVGSPPSNAAPADFSVLAPPLIEEGVDAVLAYQYPVGKTATNRFNRELYTQLLAGHCLELATQEARRKMKEVYESRAFVSPAVFLAAPGPLRLSWPTASIEEPGVSTRSSSFATANV